MSEELIATRREISRILRENYDITGRMNDREEGHEKIGVKEQRVRLSDDIHTVMLLRF